MKNTWKRSIHSYPFRRMSGKSRMLTCAPYVWKNRAMWLSCVDMARVLNVHLRWRFAPCAENPSIKRLRCSIDVNVRSWWPLGFLTPNWISLSSKCWRSAAFDSWSCLSMYREHNALFNWQGDSKCFEALGVTWFLWKTECPLLRCIWNVWDNWRFVLLFKMPIKRELITTHQVGIFFVLS